jgi:DNA-binding protein YbaB
MSRKSVNVLTVINSASNIYRETVNGREHIVIKDVVPIVDDVVMNGGLYPAAEINQSYASMERKLMPLSHPKVDGQYISANDPEAVHNFHVGVYAQNVRKVNGRVTLDMHVDVRYAEATEGGKRLVNRLEGMEKGESTDPIHISTGLLLNKKTKSGESKGKKYSWVASNMNFDHVAILLDEPGAATPEEGVGIFVNSDGEKIEIEQVNLSEAINYMKVNWWEKTKFYLTNASNYSFEEICAAIRNKMSEGKPENYYFYPDGLWPDRFVYEEDGKYLQQKYLIDDDGKAVFVGEPVEVVRKPTEYEEVQTNKEQSPMKDLIINALKAAGKPTDGKTDAELMDAYNQMKADEATAKTKGEEEIDPETGKPKVKPETATNQQLQDMIISAVNAAVKPLQEQLQTNANKELDEKRQAVKTKFPFMTEAAVNSLQGDALNEMFAQCQTTLGLNSRFLGNSKDSEILTMEAPE